MGFSGFPQNRSAVYTQNLGPIQNRQNPEKWPKWTFWPKPKIPDFWSPDHEKNGFETGFLPLFFSFWQSQIFRYQNESLINYIWSGPPRRCPKLVIFGPPKNQKREICMVLVQISTFQKLASWSFSSFLVIFGGFGRKTRIFDHSFFCSFFLFWKL